MKDDRVCPICKDLEGYTWIFVVGKDNLRGGFLEHPVHGIVWTVAEGSAAHGHKGDCRCHITYIVDIQDIVTRVNAVRDDIRISVEGIKEGGVSK